MAALNGIMRTFPTPAKRRRKMDEPRVGEKQEAGSSPRLGRREASVSSVDAVKTS